MSKSDPETIIDPLEVIPQYGTDALRLALVSGVNAGQDQRLGRSKIVDNRNFCNKLWNIARYIEGVAEDHSSKAEPQTIADHWILNKLSILTEAIDKDLANFRFSDAYQKLYHFVWDDFADWYVEASKVDPNPGLLKFVLESTLILAHPFAPYITEVIWQELEFKKGHLLASEPLPNVPKADTKQAKKFEEIIRIVTIVRSFNALSDSRAEKLYYKENQIIEENAGVLAKLARLREVAPSEGRLVGVELKAGESHISIDINPAKARTNIQSKINSSKKTVELLESRLSNNSYIKNAPKKLVEETKRQLEASKEELSQLKQALTDLRI